MIPTSPGGTARAAMLTRQPGAARRIASAQEAIVCPVAACIFAVLRCRPPRAAVPNRKPESATVTD